MKNHAWMEKLSWLMLLLVFAACGKGQQVSAAAEGAAAAPASTIGARPTRAVALGQLGYQPPEPTQVSQYIRRMFQDKAGNIWFGTRDAGLSRYDGSAFAHFPLQAGAGGGYVWTMLEDRAGMLWVGMVGDGLYRYDGRSFTHYSNGDLLGSAHVQSILEDREGTLWVGTSGGVYRFNGRTFSNFTRDDAGRKP